MPASPVQTYAKWSDWIPPLPWICPRCLWEILTREASPRCGRCGFHEGND
jgi:hypothetical protein